MLGYISGAFDILRSNDLSRIDRAVQENLTKGNKYFAVAIYDDKLCEELGMNTPIKGVEDRKKIVSYLSGVDFTFSISSTNNQEINELAQKAYKEYLVRLEESKVEEKKKYDIAYAPGTYDLFHAGHLENLLDASNNSKKLIVGVKSDELVMSHKGREPIISARERMEILRHFKFVNDVYQYYTRDPHVAAKWIMAKHGKEPDAIFLGSDLKEDFKGIKGLNLVFTDRPPEAMEHRSTSAYRRKLTTLYDHATTIPDSKFRKNKEYENKIAEVKGEEEKEVDGEEK